MSRVQNKASRLAQIEALLLAYPQGMTQAELARRLNVDRSTINRDIADLPKHIYVDDLADGRLKIDREAYLVNVRLSLHEVLSVHLAARLLATLMDRQNKHAAGAMRKLGIALRPLAAQIGKHILQSADVLDDPSRRQDPVYIGVLEKLTLAWAEQRKVQIWHRHESDQVLQYVFSPYFIEPYAVGQATHVIGWRQPPGAMRTFKIERIERVELLRESYEIPEDFDPRQILADAWGIWYTEREPIEVVLRFSAQAARRVNETRWHASEESTAQEDGTLIWRARVAEPVEMLPWIRGWGADVEVLEPESLREHLVQEVQRMAGIYLRSDAPLETVSTPMYFAHSKDTPKSEWQKLKDHLENTASIAAKLGEDAGISDLARIAGLFHDIGKYSDAFQYRLMGARQRVDHATAGAQEIHNLFGKDPNKKWQALILSYAIAGHHGGLLDYGGVTDVAGETSLQGRLKKQVQDYHAYQSEMDVAALNLPSLHLKRTGTPGFSVSFLTRMLFSTLVDADWLDTETYMGGQTKPRGGYDSIETLANRFNQFLKRFENPSNVINRKRTETLTACVNQSESPQGVFTLTLPTGGGKTLSSMAFALNHAVKHGLKRIIYVIPFTSIIEQNAAVFKNCLGNQNVLEHHSNFDWEKVRRPDGESSDDETNRAYEKLRLAAENWDIPVVVTTNVQFFESLFASKKSQCRKLHNLAKSVIIFDEAQMLPREYLKPCMMAVQELVLNYGASAVFCTATQPLLKQYMPSIGAFTELAKDPQSLFDFYKRVEVTHLGRLTDEELLDRLHAHSQVLCIVNTRKHAKGLFDQLAQEGRFHLSTLMCPAHRKKTLADIHARLNQGQVCRVVSTQVMEAGIDIDFPVGYRALAGLDSIIQAAGRVNREAKLPMGNMYVFEADTPFILRTPTFIKQTAGAARSVMRDYADEPVSTRAIDAYYSLLDTLNDSQKSSDVNQILEDLNRTDGFDFKTAAEKFRIIEDNSMPIIIPYHEEAQELIQRLPFIEHPTGILRQLQLYTVNVYEREYEAINALGAIRLVADRYAVLTEMEMYDPETGIKLPAKEGGLATFFD